VNEILTIGYRLGDRLDKSLNKLTSYRLVLYLLILYVLAAVGLCAGHKLPFSDGALLISTGVLLVAARLANMAVAGLFRVARNTESDLITALILALIMSPVTSANGLAILAAAAAVAMLSKYVLTLRGRHIFNPAALGALLVGWGFHDYASWWVGTKYMAPLIALGGLLIVRKVKRGQMAMVFGSVFVAYQVAYAPAEHLVSSVWQLAITSPLLFLATVMLTEPLTSPTRLDPALAYALVTGFLFSARQLHLSPEEALLLGNALTFVISPNRALTLKYLGVNKEAAQIYSFMFEPNRRLRFAAGQYMEWTLPGVRLDARGNRRYLTLSSAPTEKQVAFAVKIPPAHSQFKQFLIDMKPGQQISAAQLEGEFVLPKTAEKLTFIAGGVGITPFRSMIKWLLDKNQPTDIELIYSAEHESQFAFRDLFSRARAIGIKTHLVANSPSAGWQGLKGRLDGQAIARLVTDFKGRCYFISGPQGFVSATRQELLGLGVHHSKIVTDFFPGYE
jgi:ferredoxin-NADP reductase